ncbi:TraB/GumN family protein [Parabacteroides pacaensis]|uniref:erythromycin esterase family protein n=1 Tax=Parabacteroides pacaensis TaxID=2086575 RepID=UPI000D0EF919|nr:erythromycin esterase family protein [Parabacteroides pacaensis]
MNNAIFVIKYLFLFLGVYSLTSCKQGVRHSVDPWDETLSPAQNIARNAIYMDNNDDFSFLDVILKEKQCVFLGEGSHWDLETIETKSKMIAYFGRSGYSLAMEGMAFLSSYVFSEPKFYNTVQTWKMDKFMPLISYDFEEFQPIKEMIRSHQIKLLGIETHVGYYDVDAAKIILDQYAKIDYFPMNWDRLNTLFRTKFVKNHLLSVEENFELMDMIDSISNYVHYLIFAINKDDLDLKAILQWIRNVNTDFSFRKYFTTTEIEKIELALRNRDIQMAENMIWYLDHFPNEKCVVSCANFHESKDISQTRYQDKNPLLYYIFQSMGEGVYHRLGDKMYSLAFSNCIQIKEGHLEWEIAQKSNAPYAFVDFESLRYADGYRNQSFGATMIGPKRGKWLNIFDGLYYIRDERRPKK